MKEVVNRSVDFNKINWYSNKIDVGSRDYLVENTDKAVKKKKKKRLMA